MGEQASLEFDLTFRLMTYASPLCIGTAKEAIRKFVED